jgi:hypothetical protein
MVSFAAGQKLRASQLNDLAKRGVIGYTSLGSGTGFTTTDTIQGEKITTSITLGRYYRVHHLRNQASSTGSNIHTNRIRVAAGATVGTTDTIIQPFVYAIGASYVTVNETVFWQATFTGQATFGVSSFINANAGLVDSARVREIWVEDVGS